MFSYSDSPEVLPSLVFTKAELVYATRRLLSEIDDNDNTTKIEMVELRHYLNLIAKEVSAAAARKELALPATEPPPLRQEATQTRTASISDLRKQFPNLTEDEISEILEQARKENCNSAKSDSEVSKPPSFISKTSSLSAPPDTLQLKNRENSQKFESMLGGSI